MTGWMIVSATTDACDENFVELLRACTGSAYWARRRMARRAGLLRGHGVG